MKDAAGGSEQPDPATCTPGAMEVESGLQVPAGESKPVDPEAEASFWRAIYSRRLYITGSPRENN
jgi:hypothetical protein